jgi:Flp pilus assembly protein TadD/ketosteroid isomerase-like protein
MQTMIRLTATLLGFILCSASWAQTDELQDATRLLRQGQSAQALDKVNQFLSAKPRDAQGRFLRGLILVEQNKTAEAISVFTKLTEDYPELPEPYNNLAVLYASQGQYDKAKTSLEMSIRTHPSYATAYENLGDVYAKLATQAYDKALQLDSNNPTAQSKLSLIRDLFTGSVRPGKTSAKTEPARVAAAPAAVAATAPKAAEAKPADPKPAIAEAAKADAKPAAGKSDSDEVVKAVRAWAAAWSKKDVNGYLSFYARDFKTPNGEPRAEWEGARKQRINAPKKIEVAIDSPKVTLADANNATVNFRQQYRSDALKANSSKTLVLVKNEGKWLIQQERVSN